MCKVMAIDPSLTGFAICILEKGGKEVYADEKKTKPVKTLKGRVSRMESLVLFADKVVVDYEPDYIFIEGYAFNAKGSSGVTLGELGMLVRSNLITMDIKGLVEVPPTTLKKFITGKGNANKIAVASTLSSKFNKEFKSDNEADAYGLAQLGLATQGWQDFKLTKKQEEAVKVVQDLIEKEKSV